MKIDGVVDMDVIFISWNGELSIMWSVLILGRGYLLLIVYGDYVFVMIVLEEK